MVDVAVEDKLADEALSEAVVAVVLLVKLFGQRKESVSSVLEKGCCVGAEDWRERLNGEWTAEDAREVAAAVPPRLP